MKKLLLNTSCGDYLIDTSTIVRVEASSNYSKIFFSNGKMMVTAKLLRWFEEKLEKESFTRLHRSHLINNGYLLLQQCAGKSFELQNGNIIPVSRRRKKYVLQKLAAACLLLFVYCISFSQSVGVGTNSPHTSAALDIVSNNKGMSIPSLTTAQRNAITTPKAGLFVFDTNLQTLCMFNGANWVYFQSSVMPNVVHPVEQVASDGEVGDEFGYSVAMDGNYAIIGAPFDNIGANSGQGSAYIFFFNGSAWVEQAKLTAAAGAANDNFGFSVAISGDYAIVGAPRDNVGANTDQGSAYIFIRSGTNWTQQSNFSGISATTDDRFGSSVSIDGIYSAIGAPNDNVGASANQGTAYVFIRSGVNWAQQDYVTLPSGAANDEFGTSVSISGIFLVAGAPNDEQPGGNNEGSAHVFQRIGTNWSHMQEILFIGVANIHFGYAVSVSGNNMAVGAPGDFSTYGYGQSYRYNGSTWVTSNLNWLNTMPGVNTEFGDQFGLSVAVGGNNLIAGAPRNDTLGTQSGKSFLYQTNGTEFFYIREVIDPLGGPFHLMGTSVAATTGHVLSGSPYANGQRGKVLFLKL